MDPPALPLGRRSRTPDKERRQSSKKGRLTGAARSVRSSTPPARQLDAEEASSADRKPMSGAARGRRPAAGGSSAEHRVPAPPAPPVQPSPAAPPPNPQAPGDDASPRLRQRTESVKYLPASRSALQAELQRGALLQGIKRSGVNKLKQVVGGQIVAPAEFYGVERQWPASWQPHCRAPIKEHNGSVNSCRVFARDRRVLSCGDDGTLRMADLESGMPIGRPLEGHEGAVNDCRVFPDQRRALSCGEDGTLKIWTLMTAEEDETIGWRDCHTQAVNAIDIFTTDPDRKEWALSASADGTLKVWDLTTGECTATLRPTDETGKPDSSIVESCCAFKTPNGGWEALSGGADNHVRRWALTGSPAADDCLTTLDHATSAPRAEIKHPDGSPWMAKQDTLKGRLGHTGIVRGCCVSSSGSRALTCSGDRSAIFWDLSTGTVLRSLKHSASVFSCCFLPGEKTAITVSSADPRLWDVHSGECLRIFAGHSGEVLHCVSRACCLYAALILLSTLSTDACSSGQDATHGWKVLTCGRGGSVRVWDLSAHDNSANLGSKQEDCRQHQHIVKEITVFPDGSKALSCSYDATAKVWCLRTGRCLVTLEGHGSNVNECCLFPDGNKVLTASKDGTIKIWGWETVTKDPSTGMPLGECQLTLGQEQHKPHEKAKSNRPDEIRGCGVFDDGRKVRAAPLANQCLPFATFQIRCLIYMSAGRSSPAQKAAKSVSSR